MASVILSQNTSLNEKPGLHLQWSVSGFVDPLTELMLTYSQKSGNDIVTISIEPQLLKYSLDNLQPNVEYLFQLQATADVIAYSNTLDLTTSSILDAPVIDSIYGVDNAMVVTLHATANSLTVNDHVEFILKNNASMFWVVKPYSSNNVYNLSVNDDNRIVNYQSYKIACLFQPALSNAAYLAPSAISNTVASAPSNLPDAVGNFQVQAGEHMLSASWDNPADIAQWSSNYSIQIGIAPVSTGIYAYQTLGHVNSYNFTGLNLVAYRIRIFYVNQNGNGAQATSGNMIPYENPLQVQNLVAVQSGSGGSRQIAFSWDDPSNLANYSGASYKAWLYIDGVSQGIQYVNTKSVVYNTAGNVGKLYTAIISVSYNLPNGEGAQDSNNSLGLDNTIFYSPAVSTQTATPQDQSILVNYSASANPNNGCIFQNYQIIVDGASVVTITDISTLSYLVAGLNNGQSYAVKLREVFLPPVNYQDQSPLQVETSVSNVIPYGVPTVPLALQVDELDQHLVLNWNSPASNNGRAITSYVVMKNNAFVASASASTFSYDFTLLSNGVSYDLQVYAVNAAGNGAAATASHNIPYGACSISASTKSGKVVNFTFVPNGRAFQRAYVVAVDNFQTPSDTPLLIIDATLLQQSVLTGSYNIPASFSALLANDVTKYLIIASSTTSTVNAMDWA
jgi:hypothetical protein